jgi:hypothetical protein
MAMRLQGFSTWVSGVEIRKKGKRPCKQGLITGLEATTEGPISKEKGSTYLVGYRYALAGVAQSVGVDIGTTALPSYQDLSFNVSSGTSNSGKFTLFGISGNKQHQYRRWKLGFIVW